MKSTFCSTKVSIFLVIILIILASCKKIIAVNTPKDQLTTENVFTSDSGALSVLRGIYGYLAPTTQSSTDQKHILTELSGDNAYYPGAAVSFQSIYLNSIQSDNFNIQTYLWEQPYATIYRCNALLLGMGKSSLISPSVKQQLVAEAKFIRSWEYFYLINYFGGVPLVTNTDVTTNSRLGRSEPAIVLQQIIGDLESAQSDLPVNYPVSERIRANKYAAKALLARTYLFAGNFSKAEAEASEVINSGNYTLEALNNVFIKGSNEAILQFATRDGFTRIASNFTLPASATSIPTFPLQDNLMNSFETADQRKTIWIKKNIVNGTAYNYAFKYKNKTITTGSTAEYYTILRLAEQYLIRAEARAQQNDLTGASSDVNVIRLRAGLEILPTMNQTDLLQAIVKERRLEFFFELSDRWFSLKRLKKTDEVLAPLKGNNWQSTDSLYPIPLQEINRNPTLIQNLGYK